MKPRPAGPDIFADEQRHWINTALDAQEKLRSIRNPYVGNKRKIFGSLAKILYDNGLQDAVRTGKVLDLFSGSAFVGYFFKRLGAAVWSNELLASSFLNALCFIENSSVQIEPAYLRSRLKKIPGAAWDDRYSAKKYVGTRLTANEALVLDSFAMNVQMKHNLSLRDLIIDRSSNIDKKIASLGLPVCDLTEQEIAAYSESMATLSIIHYVMDKCFVGGRLNNGQVLASIEHRLGHAKNDGNEMTFRQILPYNLPYSNGKTCIATKMDAIELLDKYQPDVDIIYIDPPYGGDQSDYGDMYGFFEDYLGHEVPAASKRFVRSKTYKESFCELLSKLPRNAIWIFSYNDDSWEDLDTITSLILGYGRSKVLPEKIDYKYNYRSKEKATGVEYVIVAHP